MGRFEFRSMLLVGASAAALCGSGAALAQTTATAPPTDGVAPASTSSAVEEIVVTGSRIRGAAPVGSSVIGLSHDDITATGALTVTDALQQVPQILNFGVTDSSRSTAGGAGNITYSSGVNIRGIGPYATLTLLDGRRIVQAGASGGLPDPSDIPTLGLDRVEVVPDGASAIYGSDAVAGVANVILRRNFEGVEAMARYGAADDFDEHQFGAVIGHKWDGGQFTAAFENDYQSALSGNSRKFFRANLSPSGADNRSNLCSPANIVVGGVSYAAPGLAANTTNLCDALKGEDLLPQQERNNFSFTFNQTLTDKISVFAEGFASRRTFKFQPGEATGSLTVPNTNAFYIAPAGTAPTSETVNTAFGGQAPVNTSIGSDKAFQVTAGGDIKLPHDFKFETDYTYGQDTGKSESTHGLNNGALASALASGSTATALNPYGVGQATNQAVINSVFDELFYAPGNNIQQELEAKIDGPIYHLPGGDIRIAVGGEYDRTSIYTGLTTGTPAGSGGFRTFAEEEVKAAYGEILVPIFGPGNAIPGFRTLTVDVAGRYEDYSDVGSTTNPKIGINWSPVQDLMLHGSYGTSFRAPLLTQVHGAVSALFIQTYQTPSGPVQGVTLSGYANGNPLTPETATTYSAGADYTPHYVPGLKLSINYFNIDYRNQISGYLSDLSLLSSASRASQFSSLIVSNPAAAQAIVAKLVAQGYPVFGVLPNPVTTFVYGQNINLGRTEADGFDFSASYKIPTANYGDFGLGLNGTYFTSYKVALTPTSPLMDEDNHIFNPLRLRMRGDVNWVVGPIRATAFINFENSYINDTVTPVQKVSSYTTVDLHVAYDLGRQIPMPYLKGTTLTLDVNNLFDTDPPFVNVAESPNGGGGFDPTAANPIGRLVSLTIDKKF